MKSKPDDLAILFYTFFSQSPQEIWVL
jgi:hypothetical protein